MSKARAPTQQVWTGREGHSYLTDGTDVPRHVGWVTAQQTGTASDSSLDLGVSGHQPPTGKLIPGCTTQADKLQQSVACGLLENWPLWKTAGDSQQPEPKE